MGHDEGPAYGGAFVIPGLAVDASTNVLETGIDGHTPNRQTGRLRPQGTWLRLLTGRAYDYAHGQKPLKINSVV